MSRTEPAAPSTVRSTTAGGSNNRSTHVVARCGPRRFATRAALLLQRFENRARTAGWGARSEPGSQVFIVWSKESSRQAVEIIHEITKSSLATPSNPKSPLFRPFPGGTWLQASAFRNSRACNCCRRRLVFLSQLRAAKNLIQDRRVHHPSDIGAGKEAELMGVFRRECEGLRKRSDRRLNAGKSILKNR